MDAGRFYLGLAEEIAVLFFGDAVFAHSVWDDVVLPAEGVEDFFEFEAFLEVGFGDFVVIPVGGSGNGDLEVVVVDPKEGVFAADGDFAGLLHVGEAPDGAVTGFTGVFVFGVEFVEGVARGDAEFTQLEQEVGFVGVGESDFEGVAVVGVAALCALVVEILQAADPVPDGFFGMGMKQMFEETIVGVHFFG